MRRPLRIGLYAAAAAFTIATIVVLLWRSEAGDSYCGSVLYDTVTARPCGSPILLRRVLSLLFGIAGMATFATASILGAARGRRALRSVASALVIAAAVGALVVLNRLLQPTRAEWCGSVLNRHRTYEAVIESRCDELLAPYRNTAIVVGVLAVASLAAGVVLWVRSRHD